MEDTNLLVYMLYGVGGVGILLAVFVMISTAVQRSLEKKADKFALEDGEWEEDAPAQGDAWQDDGAPIGVALERRQAPAVPEREQQATAPETRQPVAQGARVALQGLEEEEPVSVHIGGFSVRAYAGKHIGARKEQQDALHHSPADLATVTESGLLYVVCDGMGGMRMGGEAANLAAKSFVSAFLASKSPAQVALREAADIANEMVWELCKSDDLSGAGTTLIAALITQEGMHYISVGDSHIYLLRGGVLSQMNVDHNYLGELLMKVRRGEITREQALSDPERAHLTSYLGLRRLTLVDRSSGPIEMEDGDCVILASDGLFKVLTPAGIAERVKSADGQTVSRLIGEALSFQYRNQDNVSVALIALSKAGLSGEVLP